MFDKVLVKSPKRSRFDFSHGNSLSMEFGKLTPTEMRFIVPGDDVSISLEQLIRVAPLPVPTFVNLKIRHDFFFVPLSMMYNQKAMDMIFNQDPTNSFRAHTDTLADYIDLFVAGADSKGPGNREPFIPGSIHDYFNLPVFSDLNLKTNGRTALAAYMSSPTASNWSALITAITSSTKDNFSLSSLPGICLEPMLAYHYIWRDWFRFTGYADTFTGDHWLENHIFGPYVVQNSIASTDNLSSIGVSSEDYHNGGTAFSSYLGVPYYAYLKKDPYTSARYGTKPAVLIPTGVAGTIPNLREASALQKFIDIVTVTGQRYWDKIKGIFNETPSGMKCERAQLLARYQQYIKVGEVITTATTTQATTGDYAGRAMLVDGKYIFKRHFTEHGWLMCISSVVPEMAYNGIDRQLVDHNILDTPIPQFANIGDQSVANYELRVQYDPNFPNGSSFGNQFRYYAYKADVNRIHGDFLLQSMQPWTAILPQGITSSLNARDFGWVDPAVWNKIFNATSSAYPYAGRFFVDLTFHEFITRSLPKYVSYAL